MISILIRAFLIYLFITFLRNIWRAYKFHSQLKGTEKNSIKKKYNDKDTVDAEFRELNDD